MEMVDARETIESFFLTLKDDTYVLIRIQALVALVTAMFFVMFIVDFYRCRTRSSILTTVFKAVDSLSDRIVVYLLGSMQAASFENEMFPVWAIVLVSLRASLGYLSGYGIPDRDRRLSEVGNVIKFMGAGLLNRTRGLEFARPLWSLWAILLLKSLYRFLAHDRAIRSLWHGRSSELLPEYMSGRVGDHEQGQGNLAANGEQRFLVCGETKQEMELRKPTYTLHLEDAQSASLITLDKISDCTGLNFEIEVGRRYKDMSLAFTLSRLLRCRLEDVALDRESIDSTQNLVTTEITDSQETTVENEAKRAFRILELELGFMRDYFCTLYPVVFWSGLGSLCFSLLLSMATFAVALWLAVDIRKEYRNAPADNFMLEMHGGNVDVLITWVFLLFMMFKEVWEMVTYLVSNWTRLLLVCKYVQNQSPLRRFKECLLRSFDKSKIADTWHGQIDQYDFLQSCNYRPLFRKVASAISLGQIEQKSDGKKSGKAIKIPECVKPAVLQALRLVGLTGTELPKGIPSLKDQQFQRYKWACDLQTCSHVILVWHIATSLCEIKLAKENGIDLTKPGFLRSAWSWLKNIFCCTSQPYLVNKEDKLHDSELKNNYHTAITLSRYCAYLQAFLPQLLPDSFTVPDLIFEETLKDARKELKGCNLTCCRYEKLMMGILEKVTTENVDRPLGTNMNRTGEEDATENVDRPLGTNTNRTGEEDATENVDRPLGTSTNRIGGEEDATENAADQLPCTNIVKQGATLAKALIENEEKIRWKILAGVWADLLVHIAPSWNAADHKDCLESGGEFITLVWALLSHCGIQRSKLWDKDGAPRGNTQQQLSESSNAQVHRQGNNDETSSSIQAVEDQPDEDGIESEQETEVIEQLPTVYHAT